MKFIFFVDVININAGLVLTPNVQISQIIYFKGPVISYVYAIRPVAFGCVLKYRKATSPARMWVS